MGVGGRGKCPGAPSHHLRRQKEQGNWYGKDSRPKGTVKSRMAKNGNGKFKKKKKKKKLDLLKQGELDQAKMLSPLTKHLENTIISGGGLL
jgi:hypothetical protein